MGKGMYGYSAATISRKAEKRGISTEAYLHYLELKQKPHSKAKVDRATEKSS